MVKRPSLSPLEGHSEVPCVGPRWDGVPFACSSDQLKNFWGFSPALSDSPHSLLGVTLPNELPALKSLSRALLSGHPKHDTH